MEHGFRRNHDMVYRPHCEGCRSCSATRVDVAAFTPSRSQRRCWKQNDDLQISVAPLHVCAERKALYHAYEVAIHQRDDNDLSLVSQQATGIETIELHARYADGRLCAVSIVDIVAHGISSVYCYFDPRARKRSLGTYMALQEIELCRRYHKKWLYLGYYVADCQKLSYKARFQPMQIFTDEAWCDYQHAQ